MIDPNPMLDSDDFLNSSTKEELIAIMKAKGIPHQKIVENLAYESQLRHLQVELVKLQQ